MIFDIFCISGLNESATGYGQGMRDVAERLRSLPDVNVNRFDYRAGAEIASYIRAMPDAAGRILIGHSFGGHAAASVAAAIYPRECDLILIDPVPTVWASRWFTGIIGLPENVTTALCISGSRSVAKTKPIPERTGRWQNREMPGDHNSVMRAVETHQAIVDRVSMLIRVTARK